jgi:dTDP-D-glucose 4,6-dehydratase
VAEIHGERPNITLEDWRTGDQRYYVSNTASFSAATGWSQSVGVESGVRRLYEWLVESRVMTRRSTRTRRRVVGSRVTSASGATGIQTKGDAA